MGAQKSKVAREVRHISLSETQNPKTPKPRCLIPNQIKILKLNQNCVGE